MRQRKRLHTLAKLSLLPVALLILISVACGGAVQTAGTGGSDPTPTPKATPTPTSTPTSTPTPTPTPRLTLQLSTETVSFGSVPVGASLSQRVTLLNTGTDRVQVTAANPTGMGFSVKSPHLPANILPGAKLTFSVTFMPEITGPGSGTISFVSNASNSPSVLNLDGTGVSAGDHTVELGWAPSTSAVVGYYIYRSVDPGGPYQLLNDTLETQTAYSDQTVLSGLTYRYVVTAVDENGGESPYSNPAVATVPTP